MAVIFSYADVKLSFVGKRRLKAFIPLVFKAESIALHRLNYVFCSDDYLLNVNRQFLQHDFFTDIITFDLSDAAEDGITGEIYISVDRVEENAKELGLSFVDEVLRVVFHGALHLCGYGDKTNREIETMRYREDYFLRLYKESI